LRSAHDFLMKIRDALPEDASAACEVMRRSIGELWHAPMIRLRLRHVKQPLD
jgi:hypothetical protein